MARQRALRREAPLVVIGLGLAPQLVETVPAGETDERLDMVVHPSGTLAYASTEDLREGARLRAEAGGAAGGAEGGADQPGKRTAPEEDGSEDDGEKKVPVGLEEQVDLAAGTYKYVCLRVTPAGSGAAPFLVVRSAPGSYHANVAEPAVANFEARGYRVEALGGGRIKFDPRWQTVHIYGYSVGLGGGEGGPPGRNMRDHSEAAALVRRRLPDYEVTFSADGY